MDVLFRGKRVDNENWIQGYLFSHWGKSYILWEITNVAQNMIEVIPDTVGRWTGFKDRKGNKIFEGDILEFIERMGENYWIKIEIFDEPPYNFVMTYIKKPNADIRGISDGISETLEDLPIGSKVIGNIYDNTVFISEDDYLKSLGIEVKELDKNIKKLVYLFNKIGLRTEFSCEGHEKYEHPCIIFDSYVTEDDIHKVASKILSANGYLGEFHLWVRKDDSDDVCTNWMFLINCPFENISDRINLINKVENKIRKECMYEQV